jgi:hypothetical protein
MCHPIECQSAYVECQSANYSFGACHSSKCHSTECHSTSCHPIECQSAYVECQSANYSFAECHSSKCHPTESHGTLSRWTWKSIIDRKRVSLNSGHEQGRS